MPDSIAQPVHERRLTRLRRGVQVAMLGLLGQWALYGIIRCPFPVPFVDCQNCPVITCWGRITTLFWGFWLALPLTVLLFGRAFCGWLCPGGLLNQMLGRIAPLKLRSNSPLIRFSSWGTVLGLVVALALWLGLDNPRWMVPIRVGEFQQAVMLSFEHAGLNWLIRTGVLLAFIVAGLVAANLWCRVACPTGGMLELLKRFSLFKVYKTPECNDCDKCRTVCEMGTRPAEQNCTNCADCVGSCPVNVIKIGKVR